MVEENKPDEKTEKSEDKKPKTAEAGDAEGSEPQATTLVDEANTAAKRLEEANERKAELLRQEEGLQSRKEALTALGGGSPAGTQSNKPQFTEEEKESRARIKAVGDASGAAWAKKYE